MLNCFALYIIVLNFAHVELAKTTTNISSWTKLVNKCDVFTSQSNFNNVINLVDVYHE